MKGRKGPAVLLGLLLLAQVLLAQTTSSSVFYSVMDRGSTTFQTFGGTTQLITGYSKVQPASGTAAPASVAIFGLRQNGVLVTETGVPAVVPIFNGTMYVEMNGPTNTGIAIANPNPAPSVISFTLRNTLGNTVRQGTINIGPSAQLAAFLHETPFNMAGTFAGSLELESALTFGVIALRTHVNQQGEFLVSTQAVGTGLPSSTPVLLAQFADGGGWRTRVELVNATDFPITGTVQFFNQGTSAGPATPIALTVNNQFGVSFNYNIPARAATTMQTSGSGTAIRVGSVRITPTGATSAPTALAGFSFTQAGILLTEASVMGQPTATAQRLYAEADRRTGDPSLQSGIAIANTSSTSATVTLELRNPDGSPANFATVRLIPAFGQLSEFLRELFPSLPDSFSGVLRITSGTTPIAVAGLRSRYNERNEFIITTMPVSDETKPAPSGDLIFPHIVDGSGYSTQFVLFSGVNGQSANGAVRFFTRTGQPLNLTTR